MRNRFSITLFLLTALGTGVFAQQWTPPQPVMTRTVFKDFLAQHFYYPEAARQKREEGTVRIAFAVDKAGKVSQRYVTEGVSPSVDSAALQLFDLILWKPAKKYGLPVDCPVSENREFELNFNRKKYAKLVTKRGYDALPQPFLPVSHELTIYLPRSLDQAPEPMPDTVYRSLNEFIYNQLRYPENALKFNISGVVRLGFVIEATGLPSNFVVKDAVGGGCTEEALRVAGMIRWMPGILNGKAVRTQSEISIRFDNPAQLREKTIINQQNSGL